jgi:hypothetical protein
MLNHPTLTTGDIMSNFNYTSAAVAVTSHERKSARLESTYDDLAGFFTLTPDTDSADVTQAARTIVLDGAHNDGTATGAALTVEDLTGRDPGNIPTRTYWKAARAVRIGLVAAVKRANPSEDSNEEDTTDYMAKIIAAVDNGVTHNLDAAAIAKAVQDHVESLLS